MRVTATGGQDDDGLTPAQRVLPQLDKVRPSGDGRWMACCPAHDDRNPSLSVREVEGGKLLLHCFAGCEFGDVVRSLGLQQRHLFAADLDPTARLVRMSNASLRELGEARITVSMAEENVRAGVVLTDDDWMYYAQARQTLVNAGIDPGPELTPSGLLVKPLPPSLNDFQALDFPVLDPILGPFTTQQLTLLFAPPGAGKTMLGLSIALAMAECRDFLGWKAHRQCRVLYIDGEMAARMMQDRFSDQRSESLFIANLHGWGVGAGYESVNLATESGQAVLDDWIDRLGIDVIFLDNFMTLAWVDGVSFSSDEVWTPVRRWCLRHRGEGRTIVIVDHANSQGTVFGTKTKTHQVDLSAVLEPVSDDNDDLAPAGFGGEIPAKKLSQATLVWQKRRGYSEHDELVANKHLHIGAVGQDWKWEFPAERRLIQIRKLRMEGMTLRQIAEELGISKSTVDRIWKKVQIEDVNN